MPVPSLKQIFNTVLIILLLSLSLPSFAFTIKGRVASATDDTSLPGATLRMLSLPDSTLIQGAITDNNGNFTLTTSRIKKGGQYAIVFTYIGFQTTYKNIHVRNLNQKPVDLKDVYMQEDARILGEAIVSATPPPMIIREDTIEYYADSYKTQPDAVVEDLIKRLPGVEVGTDGSITAQGETVQQIYVDGKEFFGQNSQVAMKNLTANMIESVQIVDMKNEESRLTGIDDGERRKVINLKLKPKMRRGWFGNAAGAWGDGKDISDRFETKGMIGYFRGNYQNALIANANNTNNTGFGDLGDRVMSGSSMRGNRMSGGRGNGLNTSWSVGLNVNYDEGNRMSDINTPLSIGGDVLYGGSKQDEYSKRHRINYLKSGNTITDSENFGNNRSQNAQVNMKFEYQWGEEKEHRIQIRPTLEFNRTQTEDYDQSSTQYEDSMFLYDGTWHNRYISQTQSSNTIDQEGVNYGINATYSYSKKLERGRRRSSITLAFSGRINDGDHYTRSYTSYDSLQVSDLALNNDTTIHQWQEEESHNESYRVRITHVEPLAERHSIELSATAQLSNRNNRNLYHFWDNKSQQYGDSINGRSNLDYNSDTYTTNVNYTATISYRTTQENYNLNIGIDVLPQSQEYEDKFDHTRDYKRHYINYAPRLQYRYNWDRRTNLQINYRGSTSQPSMNQLQARKNQTSATHVRLGNKDLDPSFSNNLTIRYRRFNEETYSSIEASLNGSASFNTLSSKRWYSENLRTDTTITVNISGLGNWSVNGSFRGSYPFYDNLWYATTSTQINYQENVGYANLRNTDSRLNHTRTTSARQQAGIAYRGEKLNVELRGNYNIQYTEASIAANNNLGATQNFGGRFNVQYLMPWDITLSSDLNYTARRGYSAGIHRNQTIWNAQISKSFLEKKNLTTFVKIFDILQEKSSISRNVSATSLEDRETTVLGQYFLVGLSMRFNKMGPGRGNGRGFRPSGGEGENPRGNYSDRRSNGSPENGGGRRQREY